MLLQFERFNQLIWLIFAVLYFYQLVYVMVSLFPGSRRQKETCQPRLHRYAVISAARNEEKVIGHLIASIKQQNYPAGLLDVFVVADNCTDQTAAAARAAGAIVYERFDYQQVGKGYALDYFFKQLQQDNLFDQYEGFFIFDADNLLDANYISEMNRLFDQGKHNVITSYRNSKNYDTNWISAGSSLWFLREARFLNYSRTLLNTSCAVSGTGFLLKKSIIEQNKGWKYHLLTEDIEFSIDCILHGEKIGYCPTAVFYDEQPYTFQQSWLQRLRWAKGFYQVFQNYGAKLGKALFQGNQHLLSSYDMLMTILPSMFLTLFSLVVDLGFLVFGLYGNLSTHLFSIIVPTAAMALAGALFNFYAVLFLMGALTTMAEWKRINCVWWKKILYSFSFPIFIASYIPISLVALFQKVEWKPISHTVTKTIEQVR
ncbi:MAG: glycosyltransferase [Negativicutes bacterium]|nr:glycosyltransferase [Negativicutes bacterium]